MSDKLQVLVVSFAGLDGVEKTIASLRQDDIELIVIDGGSDSETQGWIKMVADKYLLLNHNPGLDNLLIECKRTFLRDDDDVYMLAEIGVEYKAGYSEEYKLEDVDEPISENSD